MSASPKATVVDATVIVKWYLPEIYSDECIAVLRHAPRIATVDLVFSQLASSLWKRTRQGELSADQSRRILGNLARLPVEFVPISTLAPAAMELAAVSSRTFNDSLYLVLAMREQTKLITADHRWHNLLSTGRLKPYVELVADTARRLAEESAAGASPNT